MTVSPTAQVSRPETEDTPSLLRLLASELARNFIDGADQIVEACRGALDGWPCKIDPRPPTSSTTTTTKICRTHGRSWVFLGRQGWAICHGKVRHRLSSVCFHCRHG